MSEIIVLRGNSGSGKTTVAKAVRKRLSPAILLSQDNIRREILQLKDGAESAIVVNEINLAIVKIGLKRNFNIIIEGIFARKYYGEFFEKLYEINPKTRFYYFDIPFAETLLRHMTKPNSRSFGEAEMRRWFNAKDFLGGKIREKIVNETMNFESIVETIVRDVTECRK